MGMNFTSTFRQKKVGLKHKFSKLYAPCSVQVIRWPQMSWPLSEHPEEPEWTLLCLDDGTAYYAYPMAVKYQ